VHSKNKAIPVHPKVSRRLRLPEFLEYQHIKVVRFLALHTGSLYPPKNIPGVDFC
jgi:hypothetical protein